ncbi:MAG: GWxTD domain-containing protein [Bacteroidota bacterium]
MKMKNLGLMLICLLMSGLLKALDTSISFATFNSPAKPYVEIYLHIVGKTVSFAPIDSTTKQASIEVVILFKQNGEVVKFDKYALNSPLTSQAIDFIDLKRYSLDNGDYELEITVQDQNDKKNQKTYKSPLAVSYGSESLLQSDVQLLASYKPSKQQNAFVKNGVYLEPLPFNFYSKRFGRLMFYSEIYNLDKEIADEKYKLRYFIESVKGNGERETVMLGHKTRSVSNIDVVLINMDIKTLPSGNYDLVVEVRTEQNKLLSSKKVFFQRSNPYLLLEELKKEPVEDFVTDLTEEELKYSMQAIAMNIPDADVEVVNLMLKNKEIVAQKRYLFNYWARYNPTQPEESYKKYMEVARAVDNTYEGGFRHGFETDRGWIFMKYGKPHDVVSIEDEPTAPPYEIWSYNTLPRTGQRNVKFLFYNPSLATGGHVLLHSTARGEINNPNWEADLYRGEPGPAGDNINNFQVQKRAREFFNDF